MEYLSEFSDYIFNNYIIERCPFLPSIWAELFHKQFNSQFYSLHPPSTSVIENLKLILIENKWAQKE